MVALLGAACLAARGQGWTVKPEWVQAHEEFLASDALQGRGSATRDEEIAATYVGSEFLSYGLKTAPGMSGYIQAAKVIEKRLDGSATLAVGSVAEREGAGFDLVSSSGESVEGPLMRVKTGDASSAKVKDAVVLLEGVNKVGAAYQAMRTLWRDGAAAVLLPGEGEIAGLYAMVGGKTQTPVTVEGAQDGLKRTTLVLHADALKVVEGEKDGALVRLTVGAASEQPDKHTYNAIGYLPGTDESAGTILLSAHLDHLGVGRAVKGDAIYNGANDDAAGTTAVLELAHALAASGPMRRSVLFVCYGSEEAGELGSTYFGEHPPIALKQIVANLEFEMIGNQDPKMPKGVLLLTGWERSNLGPKLKAHGALLGPDPYPEQHFFERSDNYALALKGVVAHTAAGWGTPPTYHQPDDDLAHLDIGFMTRAIQSLVEPVRWLAASDFRPAWNAGGQPQARGH